MAAMACTMPASAQAAAVCKRSISPADLTTLIAPTVALASRQITPGNTSHSKR
jgi:hypothetical protein